VAGEVVQEKGEWSGYRICCQLAGSTTLYSVVVAASQVPYLITAALWLVSCNILPSLSFQKHFYSSWCITSPSSFYCIVERWWVWVVRGEEMR